MTSIRFGLMVLFSMALFLGGAAGRQEDQQTPAILTKYLSKQNYAIRFVYHPPSEDFPVAPTIFQQVESEDPRFDTWSTDFPAGLRMWISPEDMKRLAEGLAKLNLAWVESPNPMVFEKERKNPCDPHAPWKMPMPRGKGMEVDVTCAAGSAWADLPTNRICSSMEGLDGMFSTPTAAHMFRSSRVEWGCTVPGFNRFETLPDYITQSEAAILVYLLPIASDLRSKGSDIDWESLNYPNLKGLAARYYWFFVVYKGPQKAKGSAPIGRFAVNNETADVWDMDSGKLVQSHELEGVQAVLRREHNISAPWIEHYRNFPPFEHGSK